MYSVYMFLVFDDKTRILYYVALYLKSIFVRNKMNAHVAICNDMLCGNKDDDIGKLFGNGNANKQVAMATTRLDSYSNTMEKRIPHKMVCKYIERMATPKRLLPHYCSNCCLRYQKFGLFGYYCCQN